MKRNFNKMNRLYKILAFFLLFIMISTGAEILTLPSEQEITIEEYGNISSKNHILWLHSERGISDQLQKVLLNISKQQDIHIVLPDWLNSYFIGPSRSSLEKIPQQDFEDLIAHYSKLYKKDNSQGDKLFIVASGRSAGLILNTAHRLQSKGNDFIAGIILISPYLHKQTPDIGNRVEYQKIASFSNLPLYIFQAERSPRFVPLPHLVEALQQGGSAVYTHVLKNITGGYHARDKEDLTERDLKARDELPKQLANALYLLAQTEKAPLKPLEAYEKNIRKKKSLRLQTPTMKAQKLNLTDIHGRAYNLSDYKGKNVLISFWASWCRPCIEEMPSLVKLKEKYKDSLEILAVNVREDKATIERFTTAMGINFPLLQDHDGKAVEDWKVYVYPSNYIVDKRGVLRSAATGALDWQNSDIEKLIDEL